MQSAIISYTPTVAIKHPGKRAGWLTASVRVAPFMVAVSLFTLGSAGLRALQFTT